MVSEEEPVWKLSQGGEPASGLDGCENSNLSNSAGSPAEETWANYFTFESFPSLEKWAVIRIKSMNVHKAFSRVAWCITNTQ